MDDIITTALLDHIKQLAQRAGLTVDDGLVGERAIIPNWKRALTIKREGDVGVRGAQLHTHAPGPATFGGRRHPQFVEIFVEEPEDDETDHFVSISWLLPADSGFPQIIPWFDKDSWRYDKASIRVPLADPKLIDKALGKINEALGTEIKDA